MWTYTSKTSYETPEMQIGQHRWKAVVYWDNGSNGWFTSYLWFDPSYAGGHWRDMHDWPRYNFNDGMYSGCPKGLLKLWQAYQVELVTALEKARAA